MTADWMMNPHRRLNRLTGEWVIVSAQRAMRPWQGQIEPSSEKSDLEYDPKCYLCPGNIRAHGNRNPDYNSTFVFDNDFPALLPDISVASSDHRDLLVAASEPGLCRVVCFSPRHDLSISRMEGSAVIGVVDTWCDQNRTLAALPHIQYVQIFENRGAMMGASNPHPHGQIWAGTSIPNEIAKEQHQQRAYLEKHGSCLLCNYLSVEQNSERMLYANPGFAALVPFWAVWPFEILVISTRHMGSLDAMTTLEREQLADVVRRVSQTYDAVFDAPFPYTMGIHQQPVGEADNSAWHLHAHYLPPLLRGATIRKFMAGYELLATPQRDVTPEWAAERLRAAALKSTT